MKKIRHSDTAFRVSFIVLVAATVIALWWQCSDRPGGPPRLDWREKPTTKP